MDAGEDRTIDLSGRGKHSKRALAPAVPPASSALSHEGLKAKTGSDRLKPHLPVPSHRLINDNTLRIGENPPNVSRDFSPIVQI
jgi:hypothetical protein